MTHAGTLTRRVLGTARSAAYRLAVASIGDRPVGAHITRYTMYRRLEAVAEELGLRKDPPAKVLSISGSEPSCDVLGLGRETIEKADFPVFDLRSLAFADESFDALVADQVLEHVEADPSVPVRESFRVVRSGDS